MKKNILILIIFFVLLLNTAYAAERVASSFPSLKITLLNQDPDPVEPGQVVEARFKIENLGKETTDEIEIEILPNFPFSIYTGNAKRNIGRMRAIQTGADAVIIDYKLKVDENAVEGENEVELRIKAGYNSWYTYNKDNFLVQIRTPDIVLDVPSVKTTPSVVPPGAAAVVALTLSNTADSVVRNININLDVSGSDIPFAPIKSTSEKRIYQLGSGEETEVLFDILALPDAESKTYKVPLKISFEDELGNEFNKSTLLGLTIGATPDIEIFIEETDPFRPETKGRIIAQIVNKGLIGIKFADIILKPSSLFEILTSNEIYLGEIESDDFETTEFELFMKTSQENVPVVFEVAYLDANNNEFREEFTKTIKVFGKEEAKQFGLEGFNILGIVVIIVIVIIGLLLYRFIKKRRK